MSVTFPKDRVVIRQRADKKFEVSIKQGDKYVPPAGRQHCEHDGHATEAEADQCWQAFLIKNEPVYEI